MLVKFILFILASLVLSASLLHIYSNNIPEKKTSNVQVKGRLNTSIIKIDENNEIAYQEIGDKSGYPVLQLHPTPGALTFRHPQEEALVKKHGIRLIRFDRPGIGQSKSTQLSETTSMKDLLDKSINALVKELKLSTYSVIGYQMGGPYTLSLLQSNQPIDSAVLISTELPLKYQQDNRASLCYSKRLLLESLRLFGPAVTKFQRATWKTIMQTIDPIRFTSIYQNPCLNEVSYENVDEPLRTILQESSIDTFRQGSTASFDEVIRLYRDWGFNPVTTTKQFKGKVLFLHGKNDRVNPLSVANQFFNDACTSSAATNCKVQVLDGLDELQAFINGFDSALSFIEQNSKKTKMMPAGSHDQGTPSSSKSQEEGKKVDHQQSQTITGDVKSKVPVVTVIGGGLAGLAASIEAAEGGAQVFLVEKEERTGGNSAKATSGINGVYTDAQKQQNIPDTFDLFYSDTVKSGKGAGDNKLITTLIEDSAAAIKFLENHGIGMELLTQCGGHSLPRTHRSAPPKVGRAMNVGGEITFKLLKYITDKLSDKVKVLTKSKMTHFIKEDGAVKGIKYLDLITNEEKELRSDAVILATGGYAADREGFLKQYAPQLSHLPTTNGAFANGEGIRLAMDELGAGLIHMPEVQVHPTGFIDPSNPKAMTVFLAAEALRAYGGIIVNQEGKRFCNELGRRDYVSDSIFKNCKKEVEGGHTTAYMIMNDFVAKSFSEALLGFYMGKGFIKKYNNLAEAANATNLPLETLQQTVQQYNTLYEKKQQDKSFVDEYGKDLFPTSFDINQTTYISKITPSIHYTMGGLKFNDKSEILTNDSTPIKGLYGAGEVTGGLHGRNRLAGNSLLECVVFGRIAGQTVSKL
ncbi:hypothetical protein ABK040_005411 [Willaertia magna]